MRSITSLSTRSCLLIVLGLSPAAVRAEPGGQDVGERASLSLDASDLSVGASQPERPEDRSEEIPQRQAPPTFGRAGSWWGAFGGGAAFGAEQASADYNAFVSGSYFIVDDFALTLEGAGWFFDQNQGSDASAGNFNLMFRWHFVSEPRWSAFVEAGAGMLLASDEVPSGGTSFNFTPRAGMGLTWRPWDRPARIMLGARWQHISNARIDGADRNPGRDAGMVYLGYTIPF